jgi:predicted HicB family RNase H-like nuclease
MKRLTLRVPDELHKRLCDAAHAQGVSENTLILERLS